MAVCCHLVADSNAHNKLTNHFVEFRLNIITPKQEVGAVCYDSRGHKTLESIIMCKQMIK